MSNGSAKFTSNINFSELLDSICSKLSKYMYFEFIEMFETILNTAIDIFLLYFTYSNKKGR